MFIFFILGSSDIEIFDDFMLEDLRQFLVGYHIWSIGLLSKFILNIYKYVFDSFSLIL